MNLPGLMPPALDLFSGPADDDLGEVEVRALLIVGLDPLRTRGSSCSSWGGSRACGPPIAMSRTGSPRRREAATR